MAAATKKDDRTDDEKLRDFYTQDTPEPKTIAVARDDQSVTVTIDGKDTVLTADEVHTLRTLLDRVYMELT